MTTSDTLPSILSSELRNPDNTNIRYELRCMVTGIPGRKDLSQQEFKDLRAARKCLAALLSIEENYNGVLDRYIAMQRELVSVILHVTLHHPADSIEFQGFTQRLSREAACLLSAGRQYLDHTDHALSDIADVSATEKLPLSDWRAKEYDSRLGYRAIECIRNAAQHRTLPSQGIAIGGGWIEEKGGRKRRHGGSLRVFPKVLEDNPKFKKSVLHELIEEAKNSNDSIDLMMLMREHLTGIASIHEKVRNGLNDSVLVWQGLIEETLTSWKEEYGNDLMLTACAIDGQTIQEEVQIYGDYVKRRKLLHTANSASIHTFDFDVVC